MSEVNTRYHQNPNLGTVQWLVCLTCNRWMLVRHEFKPD